VSSLTPHSTQNRLFRRRSKIRVISRLNFTPKFSCATLNLHDAHQFAPNILPGLCKMCLECVSRIEPRHWRHFSKLLGSHPAPSLSCPLLLPFLSCYLPLEVGPIHEIQLGVWGSAVSSPGGVWGRAPAEIEFGAFQTKFVTSGGNNFNDFPENQLTKSRAVYTVKTNRGTKFCRYSFTQDSSRVTTITEGLTDWTSFHCHTLIY